jgi:hypothetical protein
MICPFISSGVDKPGMEDGFVRECEKENCGLWSTKHLKCSITALAENTSSVAVENREHGDHVRPLFIKEARR